MSRVLIDGHSKTLINEILRRYCRLINIITHCIMASWGSLHQNISRSFSWPYLDMIFKSDAIAKLKRPTYRPAQSRKRRLMTDAWRLTTFNCFSLQIFWHLKTFTDFWNLRFSKSIPRAGKRSAAAMASFHRWINSPGMDQHFWRSCLSTATFRGCILSKYSKSRIGIYFSRTYVRIYS